MSAGMRRDHRGDRDGLQQQARHNLDGPDVIGRADAARSEWSPQKPQRVPCSGNAQRAGSNRLAPVTSNAEPITATPPPCGVGVVCDERAFGRASA